jgi:hypothetical protein
LDLLLAVLPFKGVSGLAGGKSKYYFQPSMPN